MKRFLAVCAAVCLAAALPAQNRNYTEFVKNFSKAMEYGDEAGMDKAVRSAPAEALEHMQALGFDQANGKEEAFEQIRALKHSFERVFGSSEVLNRIERWTAFLDRDAFNRYLKYRSGLDQVYALFAEAKESKERSQFETAAEGARQVARLMQEIGHMLAAADAWAVLGSIYANMPDRTLQDRKDGIYALERFVELRESWDWKEDAYFKQNVTFLKAEKDRLTAEEAAARKREEEGYDPNVKGIEALLVPNAVEETADLEFHMLRERDLEEPDFSAKGGPIPALWWEAQLRETGSNTEIAWFTATSLYLIRQGANKFAVSTNPQDEKAAVEIDTGGKPEVTQFYLDLERKKPYAMAFYTGTDREKVFESELNLVPTVDFAPVFYKSAASWTTEVGGEKLTFYDDNSNGKLFETDPYELAFKVYTTGDPIEGTVVPLLDSVRIDRGDRMPYSEFVKIGETWYHMRGHSEGSKVGIRPLNPEYLKTGQVKLDWSGSRKAQPAILVIQGRGVLSTAFFDIAGGKEVEVPAGEYQIVFGRVVSGKGSRAQTASIYKGRSQVFEVKEGEVFELPMGAPFTIDFERGGNDEFVEVNAVKMSLHDQSGAVFAEMHGAVLLPEVMFARDESGRGARSIGKFLRMEGEFVNDAAQKYPKLGRNVASFPMPQGAKDGDTILTEKLPSRGGKVGLQVKRHALFGKIGSEFK